MKKWYILFLSLAVALLMSSCDCSPIIPDGRWESESPEMFIEFGGGTPVSGLIGANANVGELTNDDGTVTEIYFHALNGRFSIYKLRGDAMYEEERDLIYRGKYKLKNDTLTLTTEDDEKIVLKRVDTEESES